jgi:hypothetical protein
MRGGETEGGRTALELGDEGRARGLGCIEKLTQLFHAAGRELAQVVVQDGIGRAGSGGIEEDEPRRRQQAREECHGLGVVPDRVHVGEAPEDEDEVHLARARGLVGDTRARDLDEARP